MKLDKIRFARLISYLTEQDLRHGNRLTEVQIASIDELVDFDMPQPEQYCAPAAHDINNLMALMASGTQKIEAIKVHRKLTGWVLKESKDQVEKYWVSKPAANDTYVPGAFGGVRNAN